MTSLRIILYTLLHTFLASLLLAACADDDRFTGGDSDAPESDCISIRVEVPLKASRAAAPDELNEFRVRSLRLFFYPAAGHDDSSSLPLLTLDFDEEFDFTRQLRFRLPDDALLPGGLFGPDATECRVYAVANVDASLLPAEPTVDALKATAVANDFDKTAVQDAFAMDGFATLTLDRGRRTVTGSVLLQRAAAKLTLAVNLPESMEVEQQIKNPIDGTVTTETITYYPRAEQMHVWIANGVKQSVLNTPAVEASADALYSNDVIVADGSGSPFAFDPAQTEHKYVQSVPFYSYPNKWNPYSPKGNCSLTLEIPWRYEEKGQTRTVVTYYRLNVAPGTSRIERNTHYDMRVTVARLGGTSVQEPVDMLFDWNYNMQWNVQSLPTDIKEIRYLLLNNNNFSAASQAYEFRMENETAITVPYSSSHPVEIESVQLIWRDYSDASSPERTITLSTAGNARYKYTGVNAYRPATHYAGIELDGNSSVLKVRRDMLHIAWSSSNRASITDNTAISEYTIRVKLRHIGAAAGDASQHATVEIHQRPAIYITAQLNNKSNTGYRFVNDNNTTARKNIGSNSNPIYVYLGYTGSRKSDNFYIGSVHDDDNVRNKNNYVLTISKFAEGDDYVIADPRTRDVDNLEASDANGSWTVQDKNGKYISSYYPADNSSDKKRYIAPQIRVASQWGVTYDVTRAGAQRRCASYQENGRPAGRWRVPTIAEIEFICRLSNKKFIPYLFGTEDNTAEYWCASGGVDVNNSKTNPSVKEATNLTNNSVRAVRCVYDEWYWSTDTLTEANKGKFTWGDRPRSVSGN